MKRLLPTKLVLLISLLSILLFVAACSDSEKDSKDNSDKSDSESGASESTEIEIVINNYGRSFPNKMDENNNPYLDYIEENTGLDITVQNPPSSGYMERLNVLMAGNDLPDMIYSPDATWFVNYKNQNALTDLTDIVEEHGQNLLKLIPEEAWQEVTMDEKIYAIPHIYQEEGSDIVYIRQDWLDALDLEIPKTLDEYVEVVSAFKENYDTNGFYVRDNLTLISPLLGAFGIQRNQWVERDGELVFSSTTPEMKEAISFLADLHEEGILDNNFPYNDGPSVGERVSNDHVGLFIGPWSETRGSLLTSKENNPDAEWVVIDYPVGPNGDSGIEANRLVRGYNTVPVTSDNAVAVVKMLDFLVSDGFREIFLGFEGDVWDFDEAGVAQTDFEKHNEHLYRQMYNTVEPIDMETTKIRLDSLGEEFRLYENVVKVAEHAMHSEYNGPPTESMGQYSGRLKSLEDEVFTKIIAGKSSIDEFDEFVERWYAEGGQQLTDDVNAWYKAQ